MLFCFFFQAEDGIRDTSVTGVQTCALPISAAAEWPDAANHTAQISLAHLRAASPPAPARTHKLPGPRYETEKAKQEFRSRLAAVNRYGAAPPLRSGPRRRQLSRHECRSCAIERERSDKAESSRSAK